MYENLKDDNKNMIEYVEKYNNLLIEFNDMKIFNEQLKKNIEEFKKKINKNI